MVLRAGSPLTVRTVGLARLDDPAPVTPTTAFRLASITKQLTARAVADLVAERSLSLDTPVRAVLPMLPRWGADVRVGHLVVHTAAIPPYESLIPAGSQRQVTDRDVLALIAAGPPPAAPPGARFGYDNGGYALLAVILEEVSGRSFSDLLRERIFDPLGMARTVAHVEGRTKVAERALGYRRDGGAWVDADQGTTTAVLGDGGVYSCLEDLARWERALAEPGYAPDPVALRPFTAPVEDGVEYGWGWFLDRFEGRPRQRHEGWTTGFQNEVQRFPDDGLAVVVLTNRAAPPARAPAEAAVRAAIARTS